MEIFYAFLLKKRKSLYQCVAAYTIGIISGIVGEANYKTAAELWARFNPYREFSLQIMYGLLILCCITEVTYRLLSYWCKKKRSSAVLAAQMDENTEPYFNQIGFQGGYSWGADRTWIVCDNIFTGWKPESILVEEFDVSHYCFTDSESVLANAYQQFMNGAEAQNIQAHNNNLNRVMLTNVTQNFCKNDKRLFLSLRTTDWCTNRFLWGYMQKHPQFKDQKIGDLYTGKGKILPNSLCLHLILVSSDNKIVLTRISNNKRNDYPSTWAATIGEQLNPSDVMDGVSYKDNFVEYWTKRALAEEFGISATDYNIVINADSLRVLALDVEGDIYNIAVVTTAKMHCKFNEFLDHLRKTPDSEKELAGIKAISYEDILTILANYQSNKHQYHPSTYLRLYLCYIHRYGVDHFIEEYQKVQKNNR